MLRSVVHQQVNVVVLAIHLDPFRLEVNTNFREDETKPIEGVSVKSPVSILCGEDQVDVKLKYTVSTVSHFTIA
jgi:putative transposase